MPYTTVVAGTTITAAWGNTNVRDQVVTPFGTAAARTSAITAPVGGMLSFRSDSAWWDGYDGANYQYLPRIIGGNKWTGNGNHVVGVTTTELQMFATPSLSLPPNTVCRIVVDTRLLASTTGDVWVFNIRDTNAAGTVRGGFTWSVPNATFGYTLQFEALYETGAAETKTFVMSTQRVGGTGQLTVTAGAAASPTFMAVVAAGPAGSLTNQPTP